jgi:hypothetical protein
VKTSFALATVIFVTACSSGPARWAEEVESQLTCGMLPEQVEQLSGRRVEVRDVPKDWSTHVISDDRTELWLKFDEGKLRYVQVLWAQKMMKMAMYSRRSLCPE